MSLLRLRRMLFALIALALSLSALTTPITSHAQESKPALFINLTNDDPWKVAMAAFFGTNFALKQGHKDVVIFVSVQATPMFHKEKAAVRSEQFGRTVHDMYREFQAAGGRVVICPVCMKALNIGEGDLIPGAEVATVKSVNAILFRPDTKVLAW